MYGRNQSYSQTENHLWSVVIKFVLSSEYKESVPSDLIRSPSERKTPIGPWFQGG